METSIPYRQEPDHNFICSRVFRILFEAPGLKYKTIFRNNEDIRDKKTRISGDWDSVYSILI